MSSPGRCLALVLALSLYVLPGHAQGGAVRMRSDNDAYRFWVPLAERPDNEYTNGLRLERELTGARGWRRLAAGALACPAPDAPRCATTSYAFGQKIFTPRVNAATAAPGDRPYAGWLYGAATGSVGDGRRQRSVGVELGVTGGPSGAAWVQTTLHRAFGFWRPEGWQGQIPFELAGAARIDDRRLLRPAGRSLELTPSAGASLGTLRTELRAGARLRAGWRLDDPWPIPGSVPRAPVSLYALGELRARAVARDLFLDGSTFGGGPHVDRRPLVGEWEVGVGARVRRFTAEYRVSTRTREYRTEPGGHQYGTFELGLSR